MTSGYFYCKVCDIKFKGDYKPQQRPRRSCPTCHKSCDLATKKVKQESIPPQDTTQEHQFIDVPNDLLMDISMKVLNRQRHDLMKKGTIPSNQWANVLITIRKENIGSSKKEGKIRSKFKSMDIKDIAKISSGKPIDISLKPDLEESS